MYSYFVNTHKNIRIYKHKNYNMLICSKNNLLITLGAFLQTRISVNHTDCHRRSHYVDKHSYFKSSFFRYFR